MKSKKRQEEFQQILLQLSFQKYDSQVSFFFRKTQNNFNKKL